MDANRLISFLTEAQNQLTMCHKFAILLKILKTSCQLSMADAIKESPKYCLYIVLIVSCLKL